LRKSVLLMAAAALTVSGAIVVMKSLVRVTSAQPAVIAPTQARTAVYPPDMMVIVPALVIDPNAGVFVGTGDGSNGAWVGP
jgi:hypothetical protein